MMTEKSVGGSGTTLVLMGEGAQKMSMAHTNQGDIDTAENMVGRIARGAAVAGEGALSEEGATYDDNSVTEKGHGLAHQNDTSQQQRPTEDMRRLVRSTATPSQPAHPLASDSPMLARNREIVELRLELMKHLAVAHEEGGRNLQEATRVMSLLSNLEYRALSKSKVPCLLISSCLPVRQDDKKTVTAASR